MAKGQGINSIPRKSGEISMQVILTTAAITILVCSAISWVLITNLSVDKTEHKADIAKINNSLGHIQNSASGLDKFAGYQTTRLETLNEDTQIMVEEVDGRLADAETLIATKASSADLNSLKTSVDGKASTTDLNSLKTSVDGKASTTDLNTLKTTLDGKASTTDLNTLKTSVTTQNTDITALETKVGNLTLVIQSGAIDAASGYDRYIWTADAAYQVTKITFQQSAKEAAGSTTTLMLEKVASGTAIGAGTDLLAAAVNLNSGVTVNTVLTPALHATAANLTLAAGNSLALDFTNAVTAYVGCLTITLKPV